MSGYISHLTHYRSIWGHFLQITVYVVAAAKKHIALNILFNVR